MPPGTHDGPVVSGGGAAALTRTCENLFPLRQIRVAAVVAGQAKRIPLSGSSRVDGNQRPAAAHSLDQFCGERPAPISDIPLAVAPTIDLAQLTTRSADALQQRAQRAWLVANGQLSACGARFHPQILPLAPQIAKPFRWRHVAPLLAGSGMILLSACATHPTPATLPVAISCISPDTPKAPLVHSPEQLRQVPDDATFVVMLGADYENLYHWLLLASPALEGCRAAGTTSSPPPQPSS
jgi:hypothetical protein